MVMVSVMVSLSFAGFAAGKTIGVSQYPQAVQNTMQQSSPDVTDETIWVDPDYPAGGNITYNLDAVKLKDYVTNNKPSIMKVKCDGKEILKTLGIVNAKVVSVGIQEGDFTYNYDFNNCSFWANRMVRLPPTDSIADADAIKMAKDFVAKSEALSYFRKLVGEPIITYRNNYDTM
jgi:hypothetical protein